MKRGKLTAICGPMFAGKTTYLIKAYGDGKETVVFKADLDRRYTNRPVLMTHNTEEIPSVLVNNDRPQEMLELISEAKRVFIDEVNFFTSDLITVVETMLTMGKDVYVAGLERFADGDNWEPMHTFVMNCDKKVQLYARCDGESGKCKLPATLSYRKIVNQEKVSVAGIEEYGAACAKHYPKLHKKVSKVS